MREEHSAISGSMRNAAPIESVCGLELPTGLHCYADSADEAEENLIIFLDAAESLSGELGNCIRFLKRLDQTIRSTPPDQARWGTAVRCIKSAAIAFRMRWDAFRHERILLDLDVIQLANTRSINTISIEGTPEGTHAAALYTLCQQFTFRIEHLSRLLDEAPTLSRAHDTWKREFFRRLKAISELFRDKRTTNLYPLISPEVSAARRYVRDHFSRIIAEPSTAYEEMETKSGPYELKIDHETGELLIPVATTKPTHDLKRRVEENLGQGSTTRPTKPTPHPAGTEPPERYCGPVRGNKVQIGATIHPKWSEVSGQALRNRFNSQLAKETSSIWVRDAGPGEFEAYYRSPKQYELAKSILETLSSPNMNDTEPRHER